MPELAEVGYGSIWLPPPTKGSGGASVGYDCWDPFDLGGKDQRAVHKSEPPRVVAKALGMKRERHGDVDHVAHHRAIDVDAGDRGGGHPARHHFGRGRQLDEMQGEEVVRPDLQQLGIREAVGIAIGDVGIRALQGREGFESFVGELADAMDHLDARGILVRHFDRKKRKAKLIEAEGRAR